MSAPGLAPEEAESLRRTVREVLSRPTRDDEDARAETWATISDGLGLTGITVPERHGGHGQGRAEAAIVHQEMGRALFRGPYFATVALFTSLLLATKDEAACADFLRGVADGTLLGSVALLEPGDGWMPDEPRTTARRAAGEWVLEGEKAHVVNAQDADVLLVLAATPDGPTVFAVETGLSGVRTEPRTVIDETRPQATVVFEGAPARRVGEPGGGLAAVRTMMSDAAIALAAEQVGAADRVLEFTVEHVSARSQFGVPIGSFQAVKHLLADMTLDVESARALLGATLAAPADDLAAAAHAAKSFCTEASWRVASTAVQLHGGIGFTWEHDAQRFFKRAKSSELLFGSPADHRRALLAELGV